MHSNVRRQFKVESAAVVVVKVTTAHATAESFIIWTFALNDGGTYIINEHETVHISFFFHGLTPVLLL